jgi:hypothetical protein
LLRLSKVTVAEKTQKKQRKSKAEEALLTYHEVLPASCRWARLPQSQNGEGVNSLLFGLVVKHLDWGAVFWLVTAVVVSLPSVLVAPATTIPI